MKILFFEDYSSLHTLLAKGMRELGHQVTLVGNGNMFHNLPRDIDIQRGNGPFAGIRHMARMLSLLPRFTGYDIVQLINPDCFGVKAEREYAFYKCPNLTNISIPATVTFIDKGAFKGCSNLLAINCYGEEPAILAEDAFDGVDKENCIIHVPDGCEGKYSSAEGWKEFANIWAAGIHEIKNEATINDRWYSLDGRSIKQPTKKGIYINNGKKIVIR